MAGLPGATIRLRRLPARSISKKYKMTPQFCWAIGGVLVVGIFVPCLLTWLHAHGGLFPFLDFPDSDVVRTPWNPTDLALLQLVALVGCGPGALLLTMGLFAAARKSPRLAEPRENEIMRLGALSGALLSFANFPGYLSGVFYSSETYLTILRIGLLFAVTGATCGAWIAWQAYRERHPERGFLPRFSLRTLIAGAFSWGLLLFVFMPIAL